MLIKKLYMMIVNNMEEFHQIDDHQWATRTFPIHKIGQCSIVYYYTNTILARFGRDAMLIGSELSRVDYYDDLVPRFTAS